MKYDLSDITFVIPFCLDTVEREQNMRFILTFINDNFHTNIILVEEDKTQKNPFFPRNVSHYFVKRDTDIFYRTRVINYGLKLVNTKYAAIYDTDVIFKPENFVASLALLDQGNTLVYPYSGKFVDINREKYSNGIIEERPSFVSESFGGAVFCNLEKYRQCGLENENIIGWGFEDFERIDRIKILGHTYARVPGTCWHIEHPRGINSSTQNPHWANNEKELYKIRAMNMEELQDYINNWKWGRN